MTNSMERREMGEEKLDEAMVLCALYCNYKIDISNPEEMQTFAKHFKQSETYKEAKQAILACLREAKKAGFVNACVALGKDRDYISQLWDDTVAELTAQREDTDARQ